MLSKFGMFKDYVSVNTVKTGLNSAALLASLYQLYSNPQEHTARFVFDFCTHGFTLLSMRENASDLEKSVALLFNSGQESSLIGSLLIGDKILPVPVQIADVGVHLLNILTAPLPNGNEENNEQEATVQAKMK
ncbi:hypothetical protein DIZ81_04875 [Legionella taurinensis]|uniref:Uncharacterized protein n=1 Tax=Legionella taurinensis TaxID=70611 RepID=A0AB38N8Q5_9GAMM|nr:hypothetical protein [Legionella taurinensis]MDX1837005.1 hypothetical protein [Legionella taurinensis]PUT41411.1 hypothetical protein DB744_04875 [Legionella taurinensis]PUT42650.1 hypothetical protein DB746_07210 [Legionella taurinensis]PUT46678.1 hypothetical protein DB743_04610 [Legionella taurinensis]PUT47327.1 hypothetical protein DB745_08290 [Legionella taurinensis]